MSDSITNNKNIEDSKKELYDALIEYPLKIFEIFKDFFGEDKVDLQNVISFDQFKELPIDRFNSSVYGNMDKYGILEDMLKNSAYSNSVVPFILVHFPKVRVTNEDDKFIDITHLYARVDIRYDGTINDTFRLNRSEYTDVEMYCNYMHSHIQSIPIYDFSNFQWPCLGDGPIKQTIASLLIEYNEDLWNLFCLELDKYVQTESIAGTPYKYLESVTEFKPGTIFRAIPRNYLSSNDVSFKYPEMIRAFIKYLIDNNKLKFNFIGNYFTIVGEFKYNLILLSNLFIEWYNSTDNSQWNYDDLLDNGILVGAAMCEDNELRIINTTSLSTTCDYSKYIGEFVCYFKGKEVTINVIKQKVNRGYIGILLLNKNIVTSIIGAVVRLVNYKYNGNYKERTECEESTSDSTSIYYI